MFRPSVALPDTIRCHLPEGLTNEQVPRVPVAVQRGCPHLLFNPASIPIFRQELVANGQYRRHLIHGSTNRSLMPPVGEYCWLVLDRQAQRFLGRVTRVAQFQESRVIVLVEHVQSPAIVSITIPYEFYLGKVEQSQQTESPLIQFMRWLLRESGEISRVPDNNEPVPGVYNF